MKKILMTAVLMAMVAGVAKAEKAPMTVNDVLKECDISKPLKYAGEDCNIFIIGHVAAFYHISELYRLASIALEKEDDEVLNILMFCFTKNATNGQAAEVAWQYIRNTPKHWNYPLAGQIHTGLREAFPCD